MTLLISATFSVQILFLAQLHCNYKLYLRRTLERSDYILSFYRSESINRRDGEARSCIAYFALLSYNLNVQVSDTRASAMKHKSR